MKKATTALQLVAGLFVLTFLALAMFALIQYAAGQQAAAPLAQATAQLGYPPPVTRFPSTPTWPWGYPPPAATSTWSPAQFTAIAQTGEAFVATNAAQATGAATRIAELTASAPPNPRIGPQTIYDPEGQYSLELFEGWRAYLGGTTVIVNYNDGNLGGEGALPLGGLKIQIGAGELPAGTTFDQWLTDWIALETSIDVAGKGASASDPQPYTLGRYEGVTFTITGPFPSVKEIDLLTDDGQLVIIGITPSDASNIGDAFAILDTLEIVPRTAP